MSIAVAYERAFESERGERYPIIGDFEDRMGYALDRERLEAAAKLLACPLKAHPPNWQHGRVLYAATRQYLSQATGPVTLLDIGTAKGFSALCLKWAADDAGVESHVVSVDVADPGGKVFRNSIAEQDGPLTVAEFLAPWQEASAITFLKSTGTDWLKDTKGRIHVAFVDGKHSYQTVQRESALLTARQQSGDLAVFDDVQVPGVWAAVAELKAYRVQYLEVLAHRQYAIARRR
jgi:predicted O-methyltransferase YrrM